VARDAGGTSRKGILVHDEQVHRRGMVARVLRGRFGRSVAVLVGGTIGAQAINAAVSPFLTRLFTPSELGQLGLYLAFISVSAIVLSLRYEQAIVVPEAEADAGRLTLLAIGLVVPMAAIAAGAFWILIATSTLGYGALPAESALWMAAALVAFGLHNALRYWLIRALEFAVISQVTLSQSLGRAASQVGLGVVGGGLAGLLAGDLVARALGLGRMALAGRDALALALRSRTVGLRLLAWRYVRYPLLGVPSSITNAVAQTLPVPLIAQAYGLPEAGFYALVQRVVGLPLTVVGASVADALLGRVAQHARTDPSRALPLFRRTGAILFALGLPIAAALLLFGPGAFALVFGSEWRPAGEMATAVAPWYLAALAVSPLSRVVLVYQGQGSKLVYDVLSLAAVVGAMYFGPVAGLDVMAALWVLTAGQVVAYAVYWVVLDHMVRRGLVTDLPP